MIRQRVHEEPLFYTSEEIARSSACNSRYAQLMAAGIDWQDLAKPFHKAFNSRMGRPTDPAVYLKIFLVSYLENITYDTILANRICDSISIRKFLGYSLSETTPDHSTISHCRAVIAAKCSIEDVLSKVVKMCAAAGLVGDEVCAVDSSLVEAHASLSSLRSIETGKSVAEHLREVAEKNSLNMESETKEKKEKVKVSNEQFRSTTDSDARVAKKPSQPKDMYYKVTHVTERKNGIILAAEAECGDKGEVDAARSVVSRAKKNAARCGIKLTNLCADTGYDSADFDAYIEGLEMVPFINWSSAKTTKPDGFKKESFTYCKENNCYICPNGLLLRYEGFSKSVGLHMYKSSCSDCKNCPDRYKCIDGNGGVRHVSRHPHEESRDANIARCHTDTGRAIMRSRKHIVEPPFGHMKTYGGLQRINCRGKKKANMKVQMAAVAYDLIKLAKCLLNRPFKPSKVLQRVMHRVLDALWAACMVREHPTRLILTSAKVLSVR